MKSKLITIFIMVGFTVGSVLMLMKQSAELTELKVEMVTIFIHKAVEIA